MTLEELQNYNEWIGKSAKTIKNEVISNGGWSRVFPKNISFPTSKSFPTIKPFPIWASRVRNYFNVYPKNLMGLKTFHKSASLVFLQNNKIVKDDYVGSSYLSRDCLYVDENNRKWYLMSTVATGYHYEDGYFENQTAKGILNFFKPQSLVPVFKLISHDKTGGSCEVVIHNFSRDKKCFFGDCWEGDDHIGSIGKRVDLSGRINRNEIYKGSYNYSESTSTGYSSHKFRDVNPHKKTKNFYIRPNINLNSSLSSRIFPEIKW